MNSRQIQIKLVNILYTYNAACGAIFISVSVNFMGSFIMGFSSYMEHSRWEANSCSANQEIPQLL